MNKLRHNKPMPNLNALKKVTDRLSAAQVNFVIGGSGLAYLLGIQSDVRDWDIMTDSDIEPVESCLTDLKFIRKGPHLPFSSKFLLSLQVDGHTIEIIGGFAFELNGTTHQFPAVGTITRKGLPLADIDTWIKIYELLGRENKAAALRNWKTLRTLG